MGFWIAFVFFYVPIAILFIKFAEAHQLGWWGACIFLPTFVLTIALGKILDDRGG